VTFRSDWNPVDATELGSVGLASAVALAPREGPDGAGFVAGTTRASGPTLLPPELRREVAEAPEREAVRLGQVEAYKYAGLTPAGVDGELTAYVVPTDRGIATLACLAPAAAPTSLLESCERIAASLRLDRVKPYGLGPSRRYARALNDVLRTLNGARANGRNRLAGAETPGGQGEAAADVASAYSNAAKRLDGLSITPESAPANAKIVKTLRFAGAAYGDLAAGARAKSEKRYDAAREAVESREAAVRRAIVSLRALGYRLE
jgi:hypothetical protein